MKIGGIGNSIFAHFSGKRACFINSPIVSMSHAIPKVLRLDQFAFLAPLSLVL